MTEPAKPDLTKARHGILTLLAARKENPGCYNNSTVMSTSLIKGALSKPDLFMPAEAGSTKKVANQWRSSPEEITQALTALEAEKLIEKIDYRGVGNDWKITSDGLQHLRALEADPSPETQPETPAAMPSAARRTGRR